MNSWWKAFAPRIARYLVDATWTRSGLEEALASFDRFEDRDALISRLLDLLPTAPLEFDDALSLLRGMPIIAVAQLEDRPPVRVRAWHFGVPRYESVIELANSLDVTVSELDWFADLGGWLEKKADPLRHYRMQPIPKADGLRMLEIPKPRLREMQRRILFRILDRIPPHDAAHGFRPGCSAVTFARPHERSAVVVRIDLADFFTSIRAARVAAVFSAAGYPRGVARLLAGVCTTRTPLDQLTGVARGRARNLRAPHLPQGAPTSPALANLVARDLDRRLAGFARANHLTYTRYADDLAFSGAADTEVDRLVAVVSTIVRSEGFEVNRRKTKIRRAHTRQVLGGLVVNHSAAVPRAQYDALRALLHNCVVTGPTQQNSTHRPDFRAHVFGLIAWVGESNDVRRRHLLDLAQQVDWDA